MTKKEWKEIVEREEKAALAISVREQKRGNRLSEEFFLGYVAGINFCKQTMKGENSIPEFDYENTEGVIDID